MSSVRRASEADYDLTDELCHVQELEGVVVGDSDQLSVALAKVDPGVSTRLHHLRGVSERYLLVRGEGRMTVGDEQFDVGPGDEVIIPADVPQKIANIGDGDLVFYCVCIPAFRQSCYVALD